MLFIDLAVSPPFSPSSSAQTPRAFHGELCCGFHKALGAVCSLLLLPQAPLLELKQGTSPRGKVLYCAALGGEGSWGGRNELALHTSALFMGS